MSSASSSSSSPAQQIKALLFDIGGVVVLSPLAAISAYERSLHLPAGYINSAIGAAAPDGAFQRLERGEIALDDGFFADFALDVRNKAVWERIVTVATAGQRQRQQQRPAHEVEGKDKEEAEHAVVEQDFEAATSRIDARALFWTMMRAARHPDPLMYPAVRRLVAAGRARAASPRASDRRAAFAVGALSNAVVFPPGVRDERGAVFDAGVVLRGPSSASASSSDTPTMTTTAATNTTNTAPIPALFDAFLHSAHMGLRKPDPRVYALALERLSQVLRERGVLAATASLEPGEVLFLDDIGANLKTARTFGFRTCKVDIGRTRQAVELLERAVGVPLLAACEGHGGEGAKL